MISYDMLREVQLEKKLQEFEIATIQQDYHRFKYSAAGFDTLLAARISFMAVSLEIPAEISSMFFNAIDCKLIALISAVTLKKTKLFVNLATISIG